MGQKVHRLVVHRHDAAHGQSYRAAVLYVAEENVLIASTPDQPPSERHSMQTSCCHGTTENVGPCDYLSGVAETHELHGRQATFNGTSVADHEALQLPV